MDISFALILAVSALSADISSEKLESRQFSLAGNQVAVSDDGSIWTVDLHEEVIQKEDGKGGMTTEVLYQERRLVRFDQGQWNVVTPNMPKDRQIFFVPGAKGVILVGEQRTWTLYQGGKKIASGSVFGLLEDHRELIAQAFGPDHAPAPFPASLMISAGPEGQIWCLYQNKLKVLAGDNWLDALDPLTQAGSHHGYLEYLASLGDGSEVYVSDLGLKHDGGRSFFGKLENGKLRFTEAPHTNRDQNLILALRDREGATWISAIESRANGPCDAIFGQAAVCVSKEVEIVVQLKNAGWPKLADPSNAVWLADIRGEPKNAVNICRGGNLVQKLEFPGDNGALDVFLFSDVPGSVYAFSGNQLQHLSANPSNFQPYQIDRNYEIPYFGERIDSTFYSRQGWFIVISLLKNKPTLTLVRLPDSGEMSGS